MSQELKARVLILARKSRISEMHELLQTSNVHWTECRYPSGDTALHISAQTGNVAVMNYLLESSNDDRNYVDIANLAGKTALHEASQNSQPDAVSFLIEKGADCRAIKQADWTPLMLACTKTGDKALECCQILLRKGGAVLLEDRNKDGWNALHIAAREGDTSIVQELLEVGASSETHSFLKSNNGRTSLHTAALHGHNEVVKELLLANLADCNARDVCGSTPLHDAVRSGSLVTFETLVEAGADLTACNYEGYSVQHMAAQTGQELILNYLIEKLGPITSTDTDVKTTPLHCAVRAGQSKSVEVLLRVGADPKVLDYWGRSCYDIVPEKNVPEIKRLLHER